HRAAMLLLVDEVPRAHSRPHRLLAPHLDRRSGKDDVGETVERVPSMRYTPPAKPARASAQERRPDSWSRSRVRRQLLRPRLRRIIFHHSRRRAAGAVGAAGAEVVLPRRATLFTNRTSGGRITVVAGGILGAGLGIDCQAIGALVIMFIGHLQTSGDGTDWL